MLVGYVFRFNDHFCSRSSVKSKFLRLGIRVYIQPDIVYRGRIRYKEREREKGAGRGRGRKETMVREANSSVAGVKGLLLELTSTSGHCTYTW